MNLNLDTFTVMNITDKMFRKFCMQMNRKGCRRYFISSMLLPTSDSASAKGHSVRLSVRHTGDPCL